MKTSKKDESTDERKSIADVAAQLAALNEMPVSELRERFREVYGEPTRSRNRDYLRKKVAWRIQELAEGGLSDRALAKIAELATDPGATIRTRRPATATMPGVGEGVTCRDPRLPPVGTILRRAFKGQTHEVTVLQDGFEYHGERHRSLSKIAKLITSTPWNGYLYFGLIRRGGEPVKAAS